MKHWIAAVLLCLPLAAQAQLSMDNELKQLYRILSFGSSYEQKRDAVAQLSKLYQESRSILIIDTSIDLLEHTYDFTDFQEKDQVKFYDDRIARELVKILYSSRHPKSFGVLLRIVSKRNHTDDTIREAWKAIQNIDWSLAR